MTKLLIEDVPDTSLFGNKKLHKLIDSAHNLIVAAQDQLARRGRDKIHEKAKKKKGYASLVRAIEAVIEEIQLAKANGPTSRSAELLGIKFTQSVTLVPTAASIADANEIVNIILEKSTVHRLLDFGEVNFQLPDELDKKTASFLNGWLKNDVPFMCEEGQNAIFENFSIPDLDKAISKANKLVKPFDWFQLLAICESILLENSKSNEAS